MVWVGFPAEQKRELAFLPLQAARSVQPGVPDRKSSTVRYVQVASCTLGVRLLQV